MNDVSDKMWNEYLAKEHRDIMWRALISVRSAQAALQCENQKELYEASNTLANAIELKLRELYDEVR